ncbi:MAG: hypothetical protein SFX72_13685 [Isosphaeraceae bacterium]|nr:hypothetical protein [Isosphaeraceae bacterium]
MPRIARSRSISRVAARPRHLLAFAAAILAFQGGSASAQWGYGFGGFFNFQPQEVTFLNQRSLALTNRATMGPKQNNAYANNPNSYVAQLHSPGYLDRYDIDTRREIYSSIGRYTSVFPTARNSRRNTTASNAAPRPAAPETPPTAQPAAEAAQPSLPLASFFDRYSKLVWPGVSPTYGELGEKREISDTAALAVLNEYNLRGLASLSSVNNARSKLLDYGRPALEYVRQNSTPRLADTFHMFLLSLYESLAQAATVPKSAQPAPAPSR